MILVSVLGPCGVTFWIVFGRREHLFAYSFAGPFWSGSGACFGLQTVILGSRLGPQKIMPKCTTICSFRVWALLDRSLFPDPLLERFWHAFWQIWWRLGHPLVACGPLFQRLGATFVACRFPVFFGWFPGLVKISSRAKVDGNYPSPGALNSNTKDQPNSI